MGLPIVTVDALTDVRFAGDTAAVCILPQRRTDAEWMQKVATEINLPEMWFLRGADGGNLGARRRAFGVTSFDLRRFMPTVEVDLCGHATLRSAHVPWKVMRAELESGR